LDQAREYSCLGILPEKLRVRGLWQPSFYRAGGKPETSLTDPSSSAQKNAY
jgi:hypothetical protein